jgi:putative oxidoreductase
VRGTGLGAGANADKRFESPACRADPSLAIRSARRLMLEPALFRLYSTFARGWPGWGLFLLRWVTGISLLASGLMTLRGGPPSLPATIIVLSIIAAMLLLAGLWTTVAGAMVVGFELWKAFSHSGDPWISVLVGALGAGLALIGPGAWSVDARLYGWKRIDIRTRKS